MCRWIQNKICLVSFLWCVSFVGTNKWVYCNFADRWMWTSCSPMCWSNCRTEFAQSWGVFCTKTALLMMKLDMSLWQKDVGTYSGFLNIMDRLLIFCYNIRCSFSSTDGALSFSVSFHGNLLMMKLLQVQAVQNNEQELSLFLSMLNRESSDPRCNLTACLLWHPNSMFQLKSYCQ